MQTVTELKPDTPEFPTVARSIVDLNHEIAELTSRVDKLSASYAKAAQQESEYDSETKTLEKDEQAKLLALAEAEADGRGTKTARDALDSLRGRQLLIEKKAKNLASDQAGRQTQLEKLSDSLSRATAKRDSLLVHWRREACAEHVEDLRRKAAKATQEWLKWHIGSTDLMPLLNDPRYLTRELGLIVSGGYDVVRDGTAFKFELERYARGAK